MPAYLWFPIRDLPHDVGENQSSGTRLLQDGQGWASFGPYCSLQRGRYFGGFHVRALERAVVSEVIVIDACCNGGQTALGRSSFEGGEFGETVASLHGVHFSISQEIDDVEIRLKFSGRGVFEIGEMVIFRTDLN